jgi:IrrE N-terminal-like domain
MTKPAELDLKWDWLSAADVKAPELRATWARLEIRVGDQCLTLVEDVESASSRRSIFVSLYPLAEWVAFNWWTLLADSRPSAQLSRHGRQHDLFLEATAKVHRQRHGTRGAGDGFLWPDLLILPEGRSTRLIWRSDIGRDATHPIRFLISGELLVDSDSIKQNLDRFVEAVLARLLESEVSGTPLEDEWAAIQAASDEEAAFCIAAARLGLDPYSEAAQYESAILAASQSLRDEELLGDFLDAVDPAQIEPTLEWVSRAQNDIEVLAAGRGEMLELRAHLRDAQTSQSQWSRFAPWQAGWEQARLVRRVLGVDDTMPIETEKILNSVVRPAPTRTLQAIGGTSGWGRNALVVLAQHLHPTTKRFTLARALWHLLWRDAPNFLVTSAHTDRQKVERAFAAELLAPASGVAAKIDGDVFGGVEEEALEEIAITYGVSTIVVQHQVDNQLLSPPR